MDAQRFAGPMGVKNTNKVQTIHRYPDEPHFLKTETR